ncbi:MAG: alpha-amylase family glycosyl hydrolase, partial [Bacteroidota bacterium]
MLSTAVLLGALVTVHAQNTTVQFRVDMAHQIAQGQFDPGTEFVDLAGSFNGWGSSPTVLDDADGDGIYEAALNLVVGSVHEYKGRINGNWDGREEFPGGGPNRTYVVVANDVLEWWYNDDLPPHVLAVAITASSTYEKPGATIRFADRSNGNPTSWTWQFPGGTPASSNAATPEVTYAAEGRYDVTLTVQNDSGDVETQTFSQFIRIDQQETFWWNDAVFYEIFVRSFQDSDGDGRGDFRGLIDRLDYLNDGDPTTTDDLGVTGIWLMPVQQSPSYHGYDATDYRTIENDYGTNQDFLDFMDAAHERGIRVIVDLVMNHSSSQHPWFLESVNPNSSRRDWYVWEDSNPGDIGPWGQTVWHQRNNDFFYGVFWSGMPDLNYATQEVKDEMFDIARFWLEDLNVD